jgi:GH25 family lysozyme M1 (1,4-beta-N-acetylmuramidase)
MKVNMGYDVSDYQAGIRLNALQPLGFVIAKSSEGTAAGQKNYNEFALQAYDLDIPFGAYHFIHVENLDAVDQADFFCERARVRPNLTLWVDYETYGASARQDAEELASFNDRVKVNFPGASVGLYCNIGGLNRIRRYYRMINPAALWVAAWNNIPGMVATDPGASIHQYSRESNLMHDYCTDIAGLWDKWKW